ncbi:hypothetical protein ACFQRC_11615 [Enterovirga sp. GCM10030262]|uniref:hypothetical protein n=1 Tax=Enterovirga sp. GCM10030262 TaxID=3273391 RepID=UPI00361BC8CE
MAIGEYFNLSYWDENYPSSVSGTSGGDYIRMFFKTEVSTVIIDGGAGFDIMVLPDGWYYGYEFAKTDNGLIVSYNDHTIIISNVELFTIEAFDGIHEFFSDPFFTDQNDSVNFNALTDEQEGLFEIKHWLGNYDAQFYYPYLYNSGDGDDIVRVPDAENYVIYIDGIIYHGAADRVWDYAREFNAGNGNDRVFGGDYHDIINGGPGKDVIRGGAGNDTIRDDPFDGYFGFLGGLIDGGAGDDTAHLTYSPHRIVDSSGEILWKQGDEATSINSTGGTLYAHYLDAAGKRIGSITLVDVETITGLLGTPSPSELLFNSYGNRVDFNALGAHERAAIEDLQGSGTLASMYNALAGNDVVTLAAHGTSLAGSVTWDSGLTFNAGDGDDEVIGGGGGDRIDGGRDNDRIDGRGGADILSGGDGDDVLIGNAGSDDMSGGYGDDIFHVADAGDMLTETAAAGVDLVMSSISYALGPYIENLTLTAAAAIDAKGNGIANILTGNDADNVLEGGGGDDTLQGLDGQDRLEGGYGADLYYVNSAGDVVREQGETDVDHVRSTISFVLPRWVENLTLDGDTAIKATGNDLANALEGNAAANVIDGRGGADQMTGLGGNDRYHVDSIWDVVAEAADAGVDTVYSTIDYELGQNVENLILKGSFNLNGTGNAADNFITGNAAANLLDGREGVDTLKGGAGNDTYILDQIGDRAIETSASGGIDTVKSSLSHVLRANFENLMLTGTAAIDGYGNGLSNILEGNDAANILDGKAGADAMRGGLGDDVYWVDRASDQAIEDSPFGGTDEVRASASFTLGSYIETLSLTGTANIKGTGNDLDNLIHGNAGANVLDGGTGADAMFGGSGNDGYVVDNIGDTVRETSPAGGVDRVSSSISFKLGAHFETLILTGGSNIAGAGNGLDNSLIGNGASNRLDGRAGADYMNGGGGNDIYRVDDVGDRVAEASDGGRDRVQSSVSFTLGGHIENLTLTGAEDIEGHGNGAGNLLIGSDGANAMTGGYGNDRIEGRAGDDSLSGGRGADRLTGGEGLDDFVFDSLLRRREVDDILDFVAVDDTIRLDRAIFDGIADSGRLRAAAFSADLQADATDRILYDQTSGEIFYDADGRGGANAILFARVDAGTTLTAADFVAFI